MTKGTYKITKQTWNYRPTKNAEAYYVEHKMVPYCTPQQVRTNETYERDMDL